MRQLTETMSVSGQIRAADVSSAAQAGIKLILNNRPDGEEPGQPTAAEIEAACAQNGVAYRFIPVSPGRFTREMIDETQAALQACNGPALAFCRSGARSTALWAMAQASAGVAPHSLMKTAADAGYDISGLEDILRSLANPSDAPR